MTSIIKVDQIQTAAGGVPTASDLGLNTTGNVIQVVKATPYATSVATTTYTTVASVSITVTQGSSVFALVTGNANFNGDGSWHRMRFHRDGTGVGNSTVAVGSGGSHNHVFALSLVDQALNAGTYEYTLKVQQGAGSADYGEEGAVDGPQITLMEIAG